MRGTLCHGTAVPHVKGLEDLAVRAVRPRGKRKGEQSDSLAETKNVYIEV